MRRKPAKRRFVSVVITVLLAALILSLAGSLSIASAVSFSDVPSSSPYYKAITDLAGRGIISGYSNGKFGPNDPVTRQQFAKMIVLSLGLSPKEGDYPDPSVRFVDLGTDTSSLYPHEFVATAALNGLTNGTDATHFSPLRNISRSQVVTMVKRAGGSGKTPSGYSSSGNATRAEVAWMLYTMRNEPRTEVTVSAAGSLKAAFTAIGAAFDKSHHTKTTFNFDAAGTLRKQIEAGASVDVMASAETTHFTALVKGGHVVQNSIRYFASNEVILAVPANSTLGISSFTDLAKSGVKKVGYGDPSTTALGVLAPEILKTLGVYSQVQPKVIFAANIMQLTQWVTSGQVDAGILFATEAITAGSGLKVVATSKPAWHSTITYPIGSISSSKHPALATAFCDYVKGSLGQEVLRSYGFKKYGY